MAEKKEQFEQRTSSSSKDGAPSKRAGSTPTAPKQRTTEDGKTYVGDLDITGAPWAGDAPKLTVLTGTPELWSVNRPRTKQELVEFCCLPGGWDTAIGSGESLNQLWKDLPTGDDDEFPMRYTPRFQARPAKGSALEKEVKKDRQKMAVRINAWRDVEKDGGFVPDDDGSRFFDVLGRRGKPE